MYIYINTLGEYDAKTKEVESLIKRIEALLRESHEE